MRRRRRVRVADRSMEPGLLAGDLLTVERLSSATGQIRTGEVIVVHDPEVPRRWLVKRVAAVGPGWFWVLRDGLRPLSGSETSWGPPPPGAVETVELLPGHLFLLSDRLVGSRDSRRFGPIAPELVVGRVTSVQRIPGPSRPGRARF